jgi:hypothetical protein
VDPTLFTIYEQEKVKHSLKMELFIVTKIAIRIMGHDPKDCGMSRSDFEIYQHVWGQFFMQLLKTVLKPLNKK